MTKFQLVLLMLMGMLVIVIVQGCGGSTTEFPVEEFPTEELSVGESPTAEFQRIPIAIDPNVDVLRPGEEVVISVVSPEWASADLQWGIYSEDNGLETLGELLPDTGSIILYRAPLEGTGVVTIWLTGRQIKGAEEGSASVSFHIQSDTDLVEIVVEEATPTVEEIVVESPPLLFWDDFSSNVNGWEEGEFTSERSYGLWAFENGRYLISMGSSEDGWRTSIVPDLTVGDFLLTLDATVIEQYGDFTSGSPAVAVQFRKSDSGFYQVSINSNSFYKVELFQEGSWTTLSPWEKSDAIKPDKGATNSISISAKGSSITVSVNGQVLVTISDTALSDGSIRVGAVLFEANQSVNIDFDDLVVTEAP